MIEEKRWKEFEPRSTATFLFQNGRVLNPSSSLDILADVLVEQGRITYIGPTPKTLPPHTTVLDCSGKWVAPGLIDLHVHLREPGLEYKENIQTGATCAAASGFTTIVAMPNTEPVIDTPALVGYVREMGRQAGQSRVLTTAAITVGLKSEQITPMIALAEAGAVAFTDDGRPVVQANMMRRALEYAEPLGLPIISHAEDLSLSANGHMHEGVVSCCLGLGGIPHAAEEVCVARDIILAELTGGRLHFAHLSCAGSVERVREAKKKGLRVTAEVTPHHFTLLHTAAQNFDTHAKMNPPLRENEDIEALFLAMQDGTIDAIATDHAPHAPLEKEQPFDQAPFGIIGLETALPLTLALVRQGILSPLQAMALLSYGPARVLGLTQVGRLEIGCLADVVVIDPVRTWTYTQTQSRSANSPFFHHTLQGRATCTMVAGQVVYQET